ncbi:MAG: tetratricopeptide repeat protein [Algicola sp.]|nr:tetratricopeptide repeat protein [Algicola sp.]
MKSVLSFILFLVFLNQQITAQNLDVMIDDLSHESNDSLIQVKAENLLKLINKNEDKSSLGIVYYYLAIANDQTSPSKALEFYKKANPYLETYHQEFIKDAYYRQANIHTLFSEFPEAIKMALKSLEYNQIQNNEAEVQRDMSYIGYIHDRMYEFKASITWNRKALKLAKKLKDSMAIALCYGRIGIAYDELAEKDNFNKKLFDSALYYNIKAAKLSEQSGNLGFARTTYSNIGNSYSKLKDYKKAEEYTLKSLAVPGFEALKGVTLVNLGKIYLETGRYEAAKKILDSAMRNTLTYGTRKYQLEAYYRMHELDVKKGDYKNALKNYIDYKSIEDSLLNETKTKQIVEFREQYKTAEKERQILMQRAEIAEKNLTIQKQNYEIYSAIGLAVILGLIGFLFYKQQQLKNKQLKKENELKDALIKIETQNKLQEQRLRISRDLHDNIGAQLTFIISSIDNLKYGFKIDDDKLTQKLERISAFTTSTIYELRDTIWAMNKAEISLEDLHSRISNFVEKANLTSDSVHFKFLSNMSDMAQCKFSSVQGMNIYRIVQEGLNNAIKYSEAKHITVTFNREADVNKMTIVDDGKGFDMVKVQSGNGLNNMQKRAAEMAAEIQIDSKKQEGTCITLTF